MHTRRLSILAGFLILILVMAAAMLLTTPVFAQDEVPPAPEETPVEVAPAEEPAPVEEAPVEEPAPVEEAPAEEPTPEIVPLDGNGEALSLATQEAAEALADPDPWFACTNDNILPADGKCTYGTLTAALADYAIRGGSGPIYVEAGAYAIGATIDISGATHPNLTGIVADIGASSANTTLTFGVGAYLSVHDVTSGFILKGMNISGNRNGALVDFEANVGALNLTDLIISNSSANALADGLEITNHTGNVTLHTVKIDRNGDEGAKIVSVTGNVSVTNSSFDSNSVTGTSPYNLAIQATGSITLNGVSASDFNSGSGAVLTSQKSITVKNSLFNNNTDGIDNNSIGHGLLIDPSTKGPILLDHVYANFNSGERGIDITTSAGGEVTMNTIEALNNRVGIRIENCWDLGSGCTAASANVTLSNLTLNYNYYGGLWVDSNGNISISNISSTNAYNASAVYAGIELINSGATSARSVTLTNATSSFNYLGGVIITTKGAVTLNHVTADSNSYSTSNGISINATGTGAVSILSTLGDNSSSSNNGYGTHIITNGSVSINKLTSSSNGLTNLYINNIGGSGAVTINTGYFSSSTGGSGVIIASRGAISLTDVDAHNNAQDGLNLGNIGAASSQPVTIKSSSSLDPNYLDDNAGYGLFILSKGNVSVSGIDIYNSPVTNSRVYIDNTSGTGTVTLANSSVQYVDDPANLTAVAIFSNGAITITNVESRQNIERGLYIDNTTASGSPGVTITGLYVRDNDREGFEIHTKGPVKMKNVQATSMDGTAPAGRIYTNGSVTLDPPSAIPWEYNAFSNNSGSGLYIEAGGAVVLKRVYFDSNAGGNGLTIASSASVSMTDGSATYNATYGMDVTSSGAITLTALSVYTNGSYGARLDNSSGTAGITVSNSSSGSTTFNNNPAYNLRTITHGALKLSGLSVYSSPVAIDIPMVVTDVVLTNLNITNTSGGAPALSITASGTVTASNIATASSSGSGLVINNAGGSAKPVTITGFTDSSTSGTYALQVSSAGAIILTDFYVDGGDIRPYGISLTNTASTVKSPVTIKKSPGDQNYAYSFTTIAVDISSTGPITLDGLYLNSNNTATGLVASTTLGGITVTNSLSQYNLNGMLIVAGGAIVMTNNNVYYNTGYGVRLDNDGAAVSSPVTITNLQAYRNGTGGLEIDSIGAVSITNLTANYQQVSGYGLDIVTTGSVTIGYSGAYAWNGIDNNAGSGGRIQAGGNVSLKRIDADSNDAGYGLEVITTNGSVSITDSTFSYNQTYGLYVSASGAITLTNVDAYGNVTSYGAELDNHLGTSGITIIGTSSEWSHFYDNATTNLTVNTTGDVKMSYVSARNGVRGLNFPSTVNNVTMNYVQADTISGAFYGIFLNARGTVSLSHIDAYDAPQGGVHIDNSYAGAAKSVTLLDIDAYGSGGFYGIYVLSWGAISLKDFDVDGADTRSQGVVLDNTLSTTSAGVTVSGVSASNMSEISNFVTQGLVITSNGPVAVNAVEISDASFGIYVTNQASGVGTGSVTITDSYISDTDNTGVYIRTNGKVTLTRVSSNSAGDPASGRGFDILVGETPAHYSGTVTLTNVSALYNYGDGILVNALRQVTAKNLYCYNSYNNGIGAHLITTGGVSILNPGGTTWNNISYNPGGNLLIDAGGDVVLQKLDMYHSSAGYGAQVSADGKVTITTMRASNAFYDGLEVTAGGAISVTGLEANYNTQHGAELINTGGSGSVTIKNSTLSDNYGSTPMAGLRILTNGAVLLDTISAIDNSGYGAFITVNSPSTAAVTINKSTLNYNYGDNLHVVNQGNIIVNGVTASSSYNGSGAYLENQGGTGTVSVLATLRANAFNGNESYGLFILSANTVTINKVTANDNNDYVGIYVENYDGGLGTGNVVITGAVTTHNYMQGIYISTNGSATLSSVESVSNGMNGADLDGVYLITHGHNALIQNSVITGNGRNGVYANLGGAGLTLTVKKTFYMGNNRYTPATADPNLNVVSGTLLIIP